MSDSVENFSMSIPFLGSGTMNFTFTAPPQLSADRAHELARLQMVGFFYFLTYDQDARRGYYWLGSFYPVLEANRADWGNPVHRAFMDTVKDWEPRFVVSTAKDHFAAVIRKHPSAACWSWAVEWNQTIRIVGFFGEEEPSLAIGKLLPSLEVRSIVEGPNRHLRYRLETPLADSDDTLFALAASDT